MRTVINTILIFLVCLGCLGSGLYIGSHKWLKTATKEYDALKEENANLQKRLEHSRGTFDLCITELVQEQDKTRWLEGLDTAGVSCSEVLAYQKMKFDQRLAEYDLHWKWINDRLNKNKELMNYTYKYFEKTQDSTAWKLLMDLRDPCDKKAGKTI